MINYDKDDWLPVHTGSMLFDTLCRKLQAQVSKTTRGQWKDRLFVREEARRQKDSMKLRSFQRDLSVWKPQFFDKTDSGGDFNETLSCASKRDSWQLWSGHHHPVLCSSTRGQGDSHPWGWGLLQKNIGWIGDFRRSHQVGRRLTSSWHQKKQPTWTAKNCGIQTQKGGL